MPSPEHDEIVAMMRGGLGFDGLSIAEQRAAMEASVGAFPIEADIVATETQAGGVAADWVAVDGSDADRVILHLHGGGYSMGSRTTHRGLAGRIARAARARVLLPDYRLAPEHPFPAAVEDAVACWHWLISQGHAPRHMAIAGDSAGGGLALATLLALKERGEALPACAVGLSPWVDLDRRGAAHDGATIDGAAIDDPMLTREGLQHSARLYAGDELRHPLASPLYGDLAGLPPLLLQVGGRELLLSDSLRLAAKMRAAEGNVTLEIEDGLIHVWQIFPNLPEAHQAIARIGAFVQRWC